MFIIKYQSQFSIPSNIHPPAAQSTNNNLLVGGVAHYYGVKVQDKGHNQAISSNSPNNSNWIAALPFMSDSPPELFVLPQMPTIRIQFQLQMKQIQCSYEYLFCNKNSKNRNSRYFALSWRNKSLGSLMSLLRKENSSFFCKRWVLQFKLFPLILYTLTDLNLFLKEYIIFDYCSSSPLPAKTKYYIIIIFITLCCVEMSCMQIYLHVLFKHCRLCLRANICAARSCKKPRCLIPWH